MIKIVDIVKTCSYCPTQWEGKTDDGRTVFIRSRWGHCHVILASKENPSDIKNGKVISVYLGEVTNYNKLKEVMKNVDIIWPENESDIDDITEF